MRFALFLLLVCACACAQSIGITWIGQSCFVIESPGANPTVITDPPAASVGYRLPEQPAHVVTISHNHSDHNNAAGVRGSPQLVDGRTATARQAVTAAGMEFVLIPGFHDDRGGALRGANTAIRWTQSGIRLAHLGDYGQEQLTEAQLADLRDLDILFVPAGGFFTIDARRAAALLNQLRPRVAILMHFRTALGGPAQLVTFPAVVNPFADFVYKPARVQVSRDSLPRTTEVWLMEPAADAIAVNAAGLAPGIPVAPGSLVSLFGNFASVETAAASAYPLPRALGEAEVLVDGKPAPLLYVSPSQINFQLPRQQASGHPAIEVRAGGQRLARAGVTVVPAAPGVLAVFNPTGRPNSPSEPARRGQVIRILATGQGEVAPAVEDGAALAPDGIAATPPPQPEVLVGGKRAAVQFSGLEPGAPGVWRIEAELPADAPAGASAPLVIVRGLRSNSFPIAVE